MSTITKINSVTGYGQIASGKKVNKASDNAASMAIANKLKANANATKVAAKNTREGINATKISDGAYDSILDRLQSIKSLAVKAANGTNSSSDKQALQDQINQQLAGIDESAKNTIYNQTKLMDGSYATMEIASNPTGQGSEIKLESARLDALGLSGFSVTGDSIDMDAIDRAIEQVSADRSVVGANANGLAARERANQVAYENMTAAQSRIEDLDVGEAVTDLRRDEAVQSAQIAMFKKEREQEAMITKLL
ncbi:MAG: flagellin [Lachnospiraceae bacterium]|nr:flagellin [Lachnospiraceae bacterium]